jgi:hypothetical protein
MSSVMARLLAWLLVVLAVLMPMAAQAGAMSGAPHERAAGCHGHGEPDSIPAQTSHQCCQSGHDQAVLRAPHLPQSELQVVERVSSEFAQVLGVIVGSFAVVFSDESPGVVPLRI